MAKGNVDGSITNAGRGDSAEYTSPAREVLNSALSLAAVVAMTLVGGVVLKRIVESKSSAS